MAFCSVCLDAVVEGEGRSTARLTCGHSFHLDCIGSAFNAKGRMQCPNCRGVEQGRWLYANACCPNEDYVEDFSFEQEADMYSTAGESFNHMPWCPHQGSYEHISLTFEELRNLGNGYVDPPQSSLNGQRVCPYLVGMHNVPRHSNHSENFMALRVHNLDRALSQGVPTGMGHMQQVRLALSAHNGSWISYGGPSWIYNQNGPNLHPNHRHLMLGFLMEGPQSARTRFDEGTNAGAMSGQHAQNHVGQMTHRPHPQSVLVQNGQTNNNRIARHGEVFRTTARHLPGYHLGRSQMSEPIQSHHSWGSPYSLQRASVAPYVNGGVHWAGVGPHVSYGVPVQWWAWAPFEANYRSTAPNPVHWRSVR